MLPPQVSSAFRAIGHRCCIAIVSDPRSIVNACECVRESMLRKTAVFFTLISCATCLAPVAASAQPPVPPASATASADATPRASYVLGAGDQIVIHALDAPDISDKPQRLDQNGDVRLPMIGRVHAAGLTVEELERELTKRLRVYLQEPDVSVTVAESRSEMVSVIGAVITPGMKPLEGGKTLVEVLSAAGGMTQEAAPTLRIARKLTQGRIPLAEAADDPTGTFSIVELDARALLEGRAPDKNIIVRPNDVISVPHADVVYVIGEVGRPGPVALSGGHSISVLEAVSTSGGTLKTAAQSRVRILRRVAGQETRSEIAVNLQKIMNGKENDLALAAGDILVIPDSSGKRATTRAIEAAIQMGTMIGTYGIVR
jgi:polysaccharide export outer membrane protein